MPRAQPASPSQPIATRPAAPASVSHSHRHIETAKVTSEPSSSQRHHELQTPQQQTAPTTAAGPAPSPHHTALAQTPPQQAPPTSPSTTQAEQPTGPASKSWARVVSKKKKHQKDKDAATTTTTTTATATATTAASTSAPPPAAAAAAATAPPPSSSSPSAPAPSPSTSTSKTSPPAARNEADDEATAAQRRWLDENVNKPDFVIPTECRSFVIKSYSEDDVHKSIKVRSKRLVAFESSRKHGS